MQTPHSSLVSSSPLPIFQFPSNAPLRSNVVKRKKRLANVSLASKRDAYDHEYEYEGSLVDQNMIVLRKRIHEMKMAEKNYEAPSEWMEWEKRYYVSYASDVSELMGFLQALLMNCRPSLAMGIIAMVVFGLPASLVMVLFRLIETLKTVLIS